LNAIPAIVAAGDRRAAKAVYGQSKVYLELGGRPLVAHVVAALQEVPEVSEVWVVGNAERLREAGVDGVYTPKDFDINKIMSSIDQVEKQQAKADVKAPPKAADRTLQAAGAQSGLSANDA